ncbi:MAG: ATP synthase F0 subunit B [Candidatus Melainabacteria bacterium]|nr:ATP synthase F0 subunit B [Candidatus Melainabacteria bacterium]
MFLFAVESAEPLTGYAAVAHIFENNVINWLVLVVLLVVLWNKVTPAMFAKREEGINNSLREAAEARAQGEAFLKEQEAKVANVEEVVAKKQADAKALAEELKVQREKQTQKDLADLTLKLQNQIATERAVAVTDVRSTAAKATIHLTEQALPSMMNDTIRGKLLNQFMEQLDSSTSQRSSLSDEDRLQMKTH